MPLIDVDIVARPGESLPAQLAASIADAAGGVFQSAPGGTWVRIWRLPADDYAENGVSAADTPANVTVRVLKAELPEREVLRAEVSQLAEAVARVTGRPRENVHVLYEPPGRGRIAFGGKLLEES